MEVLALVGPSGTGKSHWAVVVSHNLGTQAIIDDGLLIAESQIIAGSSAKRQATRIGAIKAALFMDVKRAQEMKEAIRKLAPASILILGTSDKMARNIANRLDLPQPQMIYNITDCVSEKDIRTALYQRKHFSKHVIPAPTLEVKKSLPGILVHPMHIFVKKTSPSLGKKSWVEQSIIRPTFTLEGKLTITDNAIKAIVISASQSVPGVINLGRISIDVLQVGIIKIDVSPTILYGLPVRKVAANLQLSIIQAVEGMTGLQVHNVNITVAKLGFAP